MLPALCERLRALRKERGLTQNQLAHAAGIARNHYQLLEAGKSASGGVANPTLATMLAVSTALGISLDELLHGVLAHYSVWRWADLDHSPTEEERQDLWDALMDESEESAGLSRASAFVGVDSRSVSLGVVLRARTVAEASEMGEDIAIRALFRAGLSSKSSTLSPDVEVHPGATGFDTTS